MRDDTISWKPRVRLTTFLPLERNRLGSYCVVSAHAQCLQTVRSKSLPHLRFWGQCMDLKPQHQSDPLLVVYRKCEGLLLKSQSQGNLSSSKLVHFKRPLRWEVSLQKWFILAPTPTAQYILNKIHYKLEKLTWIKFLTFQVTIAFYSWSLLH